VRESAGAATAERHTNGWPADDARCRRLVCGYHSRRDGYWFSQWRRARRRKQGDKDRACRRREMSRPLPRRVSPKTDFHRLIGIRWEYKGTAMNTS